MLSGEKATKEGISSCLHVRGFEKLGCLGKNHGSLYPVSLAVLIPYLQPECCTVDPNPTLAS